MISAKSKTVMYFAYGSNMNGEQFIKDREISPYTCSVAVLKDYKLLFNKEGDDGTGKANIQPKQGGKVWGCCYEIDRKSFNRLHRVYEKGYIIKGDKEDIVVKTRDGKTIKVWTFIAEDSGTKDHLLPCHYYLGTVIAGAKEKGLPDEWIHFLEQRKCV